MQRSLKLFTPGSMNTGGLGSLSRSQTILRLLISMNVLTKKQIDNDSAALVLKL
jgi:hypothetical protein